MSSHFSYPDRFARNAKTRASPIRSRVGVTKLQVVIDIFTLNNNNKSSANSCVYSKNRMSDTNIVHHQILINNKYPKFLIRLVVFFFFSTFARLEL